MNLTWLVPYIWAFMVANALLGAWFIAVWLIHDYWPSMSKKMEKWL